LYPGYQGDQDDGHDLTRDPFAFSVSSRRPGCDECLSMEWFRTRPEATAVIERREAIGGLRSLAASRRTDHLRRRDEGHHENRAP
jgi:hypothetical protein